MQFRPCIDIHNGAVKQIVGGSLSDRGNAADDNFISEYDAAFYAEKYKQDALKGGHIIILNPSSSEYYEADILQAKKALEVYPQGMQIGGGIHRENAESFLDMGASHVIVTSYVFSQGKVDWKRLEQLSAQIGKQNLVLDLSCRFVEDDYYIVTDRWQNVTKEKMTADTLHEFAKYCDEFLVHAVDVEGKASGVEKEVVKRLAKVSDVPVTYAGGIHSMEDVAWIQEEGRGRVDYTVGSALDLFGGKIPYRNLVP